MVAGAIATLRTVKVALAVVLLSVTVMEQAALPVVRTAVAAVFEVTVGVAIDSPEQLPPLTDSSVLAVSVVQSVFVPVSVSVGVVLTLPTVGAMARVAVATAMVVEIESVVSVIVRVPVPEPVVICKVSAVEDEFDLLTSVAPLTPETLNAVLPVQDVPTPVQATAMLFA